MQNSTALLYFLVLAAMIAMTWAAAIEIEPEELDTAEQRHHGYGGYGYGHHRGHHGGYGGGYGGYGGYRGDYGGYGRRYGGYGGFH